MTRSPVAHYAVLGHPVAHSRSPQIHAAFAGQTGQSMDYVAIDVPPQAFSDFWRAGRGRTLAGANITLPLKGLACELVDELSERAAVAGAVNTVSRLADGRLRGDNTDGVGLVRDLERLGWPLSGRRLLIVGAGGAARGIVGPLLAHAPSLTIANRTPSTALALARRFSAGVASCSLTELAGAGRFDGVIHASAAGHTGRLTLPPALIGPDSWCYDLSYGSAAAPFVAWAREAGTTRVADGLGLLVEQAAESFYQWRGVRPDPAPVRRVLKNGV